MEDEIREYYEKVKDKVTEKEFKEMIKAEKEEDAKSENGIPVFFNDGDYASKVVSKLTPDEEKKIDDIEIKNEDYDVVKIADLKETSKSDYSVSISGTVMSIGDPKVFTTKGGKKGKLANVVIADDTGSIKTTFWTENIKLLKNFKEGDVIQINNVSIQNNSYSGNLEAQLSRTSTTPHYKGDTSNYPQYEEKIVKIEDIDPKMESVDIIASIVKVYPIRTFKRKDDKVGKVTSIELKDDSGEITYTLWNSSVDLINSLGLEDGDTVKILGAVPQEERDDTIGLTHRDGRIIKGDFEAPEVENIITPIVEVKEQDDVNICGVITRLENIKTFQREDKSEGKLQTFEVQDDTGDIRVTVWGDNTKIGLDKGQIIKIIGGDAREDDYAPSGYSLNTKWNTQITLNPSNLSDEQIMVFDDIKERIHPVEIGLLSDIEDDGIIVDVEGRIISSSDKNEFQRDDGSVGIVRSIELSDGTGLVTLSLWEENAEFDFKIGDAFRFENARTKLGMYAVDLNIGSTSRIIPLSEDKAKRLPSYESIEEMIFEYKSIDEVDEDDQNIRIIARIIEISEPHKFTRQDGGEGLIRRIEIADNTATINLVLWDEDANMELEEGQPLKVGQPIKIDNPRVTYNDNDNRVELQTGRNTSIHTPNEKDMEKLPSFEELKETIYQEKSIETLEMDDRNVRIKGVIIDPSTNKNLLNKCPNCGASLPEFDEDNFCEGCMQEYDKPNHLLMIPARFKDIDGEEDISITFFGKLAEELLNMTTDEAASFIEDSDDFGVLEGKIEDLDGLGLEIIADVGFDEYSEERRLKPKKILSKEY